MFQSAQFMAINGMSARLVGAGLEVSCTSNTLSKQGEAVFFRNPAATGGISSNLDSIDNFLQIQNATRIPLSDLHGQHQVTYLPVSPLDFEPVTNYPGVVGGQGVGVSSTQLCDRLACGVLITAASTAIQTFTYTAIAHFEAYGRGLMRTSSYASPESLSQAVSNSLGAVHTVPGQAFNMAPDMIAAAGGGLNLLGGVAGLVGPLLRRRERRRRPV